MLLNKVIDAHGGMKRWERVSNIALDLRVKGNILATRLKFPKTYSLKVEINAEKIETKLSPFPQINQIGVFNGSFVSLETTGKELKDKRSLQELFGEKKQLPFIWNDLHVAYFFGYAFWNYVLTPYLFSWPGFKVKELGYWQEPDGEIWDKLEVTFPKNIPTHCEKQIFYFNQQGLLCRLDYTAEIFNSFARGAHYCFCHKEFEGLIIPTYRKVFWRLPNNKPLKLLGVMEGWIDKVKINWK